MVNRRMNWQALSLGVTFYVLGVSTANAQLTDTKASMGRMKADVKVLSSDAYGGRAAGSEFERMSSAYIMDKLGQPGGLNLQPKGSNLAMHGNAKAEPLQPFTFTSRVQPSRVRNILRIAGENLVYGADFYFLAQSGGGQGSGKLTEAKWGVEAPELQYSNYSEMDSGASYCYLINAQGIEKDNPHSQYAPYESMGARLAAAKRYGARLVVIYAEDSTALPEAERFSRMTGSVGFPVVALTPRGYAKVGRNAGGAPISYDLELNRTQATAHNIAYYKDNGASYTVVIGAHYDHLGRGELGGSLHRHDVAEGKQPKASDSLIHNGADDNGSGTVVLIELARYYATTTKAADKRFNYLFLWFSGEEEGLLGSSFWAKNPTLPIENIAYMLNMDMVGRLDGDKMGVYGTGTSPSWGLLDSTGVWAGGLKIKKDAAGTGSSDHTSFYNVNIPALHFFSGTHADYHKPSDDYKKLNFNGMAQIANYIIALNQRMDAGSKPQFTPTESSTMSSPKFKVTLGIVPDYLFEGPGVKVDGVTAGKPAAKAGLKAGDVITKLGNAPTPDMQAYMQALGQFKKGDTTQVEVKRKDEVIQVGLEF